MSQELNHILEADINTLSTLLQNKIISPVEVTEHMLIYINEKNKENNAYITVMKEEARNAARRAEQELLNGTIKSPLHGVPIGLKDLILTKDVRTTMGSELFRNYIPQRSANVVKRLYESGAIIIGKQNTHEFAYGTSGDTSYFGPVKNPYDLSKISGGSSSGSAVAVATNMCYASVGTDTGGSVRIPASFCNVVGMKPTYDLLDRTGVYPLAPTLDHLGLITKTIADNATMLNVLTNEPVHYELARLNLDALIDRVEGKTIGIPTSFFYEDITDEIADKMTHVINIFEKLGVNVIPVKVEGLVDTSDAHKTILAAESYHTHEDHINKYENWKSEVKGRILLGENILANDYLSALDKREKGIYHFQQTFKSVDALLTPVTPIMPTKLFERELQHRNRNVYIFSLLNKLTGISDVTGMPSLSVPAGLLQDGMPIGFELTGDYFTDQLLYLLGRAFEAYLQESVQFKHSF